MSLSTGRNESTTLHQACQLQWAFGDNRVFLVRDNDCGCGLHWSEGDAGFEQSDDGPTYLFIGRAAPDDKLPKLARRFGFTLEQLKAFRDAPVDGAKS